MNVVTATNRAARREYKQLTMTAYSRADGTIVVRSTNHLCVGYTDMIGSDWTRLGEVRLNWGRVQGLTMYGFSERFDTAVQALDMAVEVYSFTDRVSAIHDIEL